MRGRGTKSQHKQWHSKELVSLFISNMSMKKVKKNNSAEAGNTDNTMKAHKPIGVWGGRGRRAWNSFPSLLSRNTFARVFLAFTCKEFRSISVHKNNPVSVTRNCVQTSDASVIEKPAIAQNKNKNTCQVWTHVRVNNSYSCPFSPKGTSIPPLKKDHCHLKWQVTTTKKWCESQWSS